MRKGLCVLILFWLPLFAGAEEPLWTETGVDGTRVHLYLFWSKSCPHCLEARPRLIELVARNNWIRLHDYELSEHRANVDRFVELAGQVGDEARAVPTLIYCGRMEVGLDSSESGMAAFLGRLDECRAQPAAKATTANSGTTSIRLPLFGELDATRLSLPLLTLLIAFVRTMGARKLSEREGRLLKLLSGLMMLGLGALLLLAPEKLGNIGLALGIPLAALGITWGAARRTRP